MNTKRLTARLVADAPEVVRNIAFANPLLSFGCLMFSDFPWFPHNLRTFTVECRFGGGGFLLAWKEAGDDKRKEPFFRNLEATRTAVSCWLFGVLA